MSRRTGVIAAYLLLAAQVVSGLLFAPYLIRSLGQAEYGVYSLVTSITGYFLLLDAGVGNALVRYMAKYRVADDVRKQRTFLGVSVLFYSVVGAAILLLGMVLRNNLTSIFGQGLTTSELSQADVMLQITLVGAAVSLFSSAFDRTIVAYEKFVLSNSLAGAKLMLRVSVVSALLFLGYGAVAVVAVNLFVTVVFGLVSIGYVVFRLGLRPAFRGMPIREMLEILSYSSFVFMQMIATQVNAMTDQVLLGMMTSAVILGIYAVGVQITTYFQSIAGSVNSVLMPGVVRMVEQHATPDALLSEMVKVGRIHFIVLGPIVVGFAVTGPTFVSLWAGPDNVEAYWVALILMTPMLFILSQAIGSQILWAMGKHRIQAILQVCVAAGNIALTATLIRWNPLIGAALGTATAYMIGDVAVMNHVFSREISISMAQYYARLFNGLAGCLMLAGAAGALVGLLELEGWILLVAQATAMLVVYALTMWFFGMSEYEKKLAVSVIRGRKGDAAAS